MTREELAEELCKGVQRKRLWRIGEPVPANSVPFEELPEGDIQTWLDCADAALAVLRERTAELVHLAAQSEAAALP